MAAVQRQFGPYTAADNERGDDVGGCTVFGWEFRRSMSGLKSGGEELQKTRVSPPFVVKVSGISGKLTEYGEKKKHTAQWLF